MLRPASDTHLARLVPLVLGLLLAACSESPGGCRAETTAELCAARQAECGAITVRDRCDVERTVECGGCFDPLWCGGAGEPNRCGATCDPAGCPNGYTCSEGVCAGGDPLAIDLDIATVPVSGRLLLEGRPPIATAACQYSAARIVFKSPETGAWASTDIGCAGADFGFALELPPGTWSAYVDVYPAGLSDLPVGSFVVARDLQIGTQAMTDLQLDLRTVRASGRLLLNGAPVAPWPNCEQSAGAIWFIETTTGAGILHEIPCDGDVGGFAVDVTPGTYAVVVSGATVPTSNLPHATFLAHRALSVAGPTTGIDIDLRSARVAGRVRWNGERPLVGELCERWAAELVFIDRATGRNESVFVPCSSPNFAFSADLQQGTYDVHLVSRASNLPGGEFVVASAVDVERDRSDLDFDLQTVPVRGMLRVNGVTPPAIDPCEISQGSVRFVNDETGEYAQRTIPCSATDFGFELDLPPGTWSALGAVGTGFVRAAGPAVELAGPVSELVVDLHPVHVSGRLLRNGTAPAIAETCGTWGADLLRLEEVRPGAPDRPSWWFGGSRFTGAGADAPVDSVPSGLVWSADLSPGDYVVRVEAYASSDSCGLLAPGSYLATRRLRIE